jgi:thioredoxin-like negative regulator of GroEL
MAYLHLNNLVEAKKSALQAEEIDVNHDDPSLHLLLAQIYEREGDDANAIAQLQQFLKHSTDRHQEDIAKQFLAKLESLQSTK